MNDGAGFGPPLAFPGFPLTQTVPAHAIATA